MTLDTSPRLLTLLTLLATVGTGVAAGVFFAFSSFVMSGLAKVPDPAGIAAMQSINRQAPTAWFMTVLLGTAALCTGLAVWALLHLRAPLAPYLLAGAVLYLAQIVLTSAYHVPHNDALAALDPGTASAAHEWRGYLSSWTAWNHVRTLLSLAGSVVYAVGLRVG